jgi:hypothetical protein
MAALMDTDTTIKNHYVRSAVVFVACLGASFLIPYFAVFLNSSLLFFAPQILFPYRDYVDAIKEPVFSHHVALLLTFLQWVLATASFAWLARRMSLRRTMLAAILMIAVVGCAMYAAFALFGVSLELDGP